MVITQNTMAIGKSCTTNMWAGLLAANETE